jgi:hypothetical protein
MLEKKEEEELNALIEHECNNLRFYTLYYEFLLEEGALEEEFEERINYHLDRLIDLFKQKKEGWP